MMFRVVVTLALLWASPVLAGGRLTVVELFTSQGCPNCPPAQDVMQEVGAQDDVLALTWPVDYWDFLGWRDTHASPANTARQRAYNARLGEPGVYTPQMVIDGRVELVGSRREAVLGKIRAAGAAERLDFEISLKADGEVCIIGLPDAVPPDGPLRVRAIWFASHDEAEIAGGENRNRRFAYTNVVKADRLVGEWAGGKIAFIVPLAEARALGADRFAVLLEGGDAGPIYGAGVMDLAP